MISAIGKDRLKGRVIASVAKQAVVQINVSENSFINDRLLRYARNDTFIGDTRNDTSSGYTLVEICLVTSLLGLFLMMAWPSVKVFAQSVSLEGRAHELMQRFTAAREKALYSGREQRVTVPPEKGFPSSARDVSFYPDGTAQYARILFRATSGKQIMLCVEETGEMALQ